MLSTSHWGPSAWNFLHSITFSYPDNPSLEEQRSIEKLFDSLTLHLPCNECREHYVSELSRNPIDARSKTSLSVWLVDLHNRINSRLGKPLFLYADAIQKYTSSCSLCSKSSVKINEQKILKSTTSQNVFFIIVICILVTLFLYKKYYK
jgi:hypothetical protein